MSKRENSVFKIITQLKKIRIMYNNRMSRQQQKGFSLVELLIAMAIIALLASLVGPRVFNQLDKSKVSAARAQARSLKTSMDTLRIDLGRYPTKEEGLNLLIAPPTDATAGGLWFGPYIDGELPADPWGRPFLYEPPVVNANGTTSSPKIISYGADGKVGGEGLDADIVT